MTQQNMPPANDNTLVTQEEFKFLNDFLLRDENGMNLFAVHGFLTAIISCPIDVPAGEWLPSILNMDPAKLLQQPPKFLNDEEAQKVIMIIHNLKEQITQTLNSTRLYYPLVSLEDPKKAMADAPIENVQDWCHGYLHGVDAYREEWSVLEKVFVPLVPFAVVSGAYPYEELVQGLGKFLNKEEDIKYCMETIPPSVKSLYRFWQANRYENLVKNKENPKLKDTFKNWNEPCPCGSGKKFSECCAGKKS